MKKYISAFINILLLIVILYLAFINIHNTTDVFFLKNTQFLSIKTGIVIVGFYFIGLLTGMFQSFVNKGLYRNQIEFYARKNEKLSQQNEIDADNREALERKIASLEIALKNALNK